MELEEMGVLPAHRGRVQLGDLAARGIKRFGYV
jgi:hypothetical protein